MARPRSSRLRWRDARLLIVSVVLVAFVRATLGIVSYRRLQRLIPRGAAASPPDALVARVGWAVARSARFVPRATCLTQALTAQYILAFRGYRSAIRVGVAQGDSGGLDAHAWLLSGDRIVIGGTGHDLARYATIADLGPRA